MGGKGSGKPAGYGKSKANNLVDSLEDEHGMISGKKTPLKFDGNTDTMMKITFNDEWKKKKMT